MHTNITGFTVQGNLGIIQLATSGQDSFEYVGCGRALSDKLIEAKELSESGSVNTIFVLNHSEQFVFLMDGDILAGAKQNRVVNTSMLLAPESKSQVPVSCVEHGRWHHASAGFSGTDYSAPASMRADKAGQVRESLLKKRGFAADQGKMWGHVADYQNLHKVASPTSNLSDVFEEKADEFAKFISHFKLNENANGLAVFFGKTLVGVDVFNRRDVYAEYFPKILRGAAFEAGAVRPLKVPLSDAEARYRTLTFLDLLEEQEHEEGPGVGVGMDRRFESADMTGFELVYNTHQIHLAAFAKKRAAKGAKHG